MGYEVWEDMPPEEKGALLLAHHEGEVIQSRLFHMTNDEWDDCEQPFWHSKSHYRVKPKPVVKEVSRYCSENVVQMFRKANQETSYKITFNTIDGQADTSSIKMEKIK